ncbi:hypothetical protein PHMEG_00019803 [Phytophthora megakarya]|uniref:RxLR effector protein n=1 Tax=Phytophthora megakarya TaxID=4795 RepID=A0A225VS82_9STRA|nr:hypothetical protein PHMEG_00019803 [Phytophthora megakarya]
MRGYFVLLTTATILLVNTDLAHATSQNNLADFNEEFSVANTETANIGKRFLLRYQSEDEEERKAIVLKRLIKVERKSNAVEITPNNLNRIINVEKLDEVLDPKRADELLDKGKLGGWLSKADLNKALKGSVAEKKEVFTNWLNDKRATQGW